jgi:hypothetical protein
MSAMGKDPEINCGVIPICLYPWDKGKPIDIKIQLNAFDELHEQIFECLTAAYKNREDRWQACRIIIQAEKLLDLYIPEGFDLLIPLQEVLHQLFRAERRIFIRRALLCREQDRPIYNEALKRWDCDADAMDDFRVVERHLSEGRALFADLRRWG